MKLFSKPLTRTDKNKRLSIPTKILPSLLSADCLRGRHAVTLRIGHKKTVWPIVCSTREGVYKKPVFSKGWRAFVCQNRLDVGDRVTFYKEEDREAGSALYRIEVEKATSPASGILSINRGGVDGITGAMTEEDNTEKERLRPTARRPCQANWNWKGKRSFKEKTTVKKVICCQPTSGCGETSGGSLKQFGFSEDNGMAHDVDRAPPAKAQYYSPLKHCCVTVGNETDPGSCEAIGKKEIILNCFKLFGAIVHVGDDQVNRGTRATGKAQLRAKEGGIEIPCRHWDRELEQPISDANLELTLGTPGE